MTRIGYLIPEWPTQTHAFFWRELTALRALGDIVVPFSTRQPDPGACRHAFADEARAATHYVYPPRLPEAGRLLASRPRRLAAAILHVATLSETPLAERPRLMGLLLCAADLATHVEQLGIEHLHVHSCADAAHLAAMASVLSGVSYSLTLHGDLPVYGVDHARKMARAGFVVAVTRPLQQQLCDHVGLPIERAPVISMGVDTDRFVPVARGGQPGTLRLVTVARLNPAKGHVLVLEAMRRARERGLDVRYAVAGAGEHRQVLEARIAALGLGPFVQMLGSLGENDVRALLDQSDAFVLASTGMGEAAPVSVMEAMSAGLPVICSRIGGTADMIEDGIDGLLVSQGDVGGLTGAVQRLAGDVGLREQLGRAARDRAVRAFDHRLCAKQLHDAIERLLGHRKTEVQDRPSFESIVPAGAA